VRFHHVVAFGAQFFTELLQERLAVVDGEHLTQRGDARARRLQTRVGRGAQHRAHPREHDGHVLGLAREPVGAGVECRNFADRAVLGRQ
jgi:hypothetical protein